MTITAHRVVFAGKDDCRIEPFELGEVDDRSVKVRNLASLVSAGTELAVLRRRHRAFASGGAAALRFQYPFEPGYAAVGEVVESGASTGFRAGDLVWHNGPHASWSIVDGNRCHKVPAGVEPRDAVFFGLVQIAMTAIRRAPAELGERVLVSGLGLVGMLVGRLYQLSGAEVGGADLAPGRLRRATAFGFDPVIDLSTAGLGEWFERHPQQRPDLSVEAAGIEANITACLRAVRPGGRVVLQGSPRNTMEIDPYTDIHRKGLTIIGAHDSTVSDDVRRRDAPYVFSLCGGRLRLDELRTHEAPMRDAAHVYDLLESNLDDYLAVVFLY